MNPLRFIQVHKRVFWQQHQSPIIHAHQLLPTTNEPPALFDDLPDVYAVISVLGDCLQLSYFIKQSTHFTITPFKPYKLTRGDYLWSDDCLECFFTLDDSPVYTELNFAPCGYFNLYRFNDYRTPNPPAEVAGMVFKCTDDQSKSELWLNDYRVRHIGIKLENVRNITPKQYHLSAILYHTDDGTPVYYAIAHANPPDFHDKKYWQNW